MKIENNLFFDITYLHDKYYRESLKSFKNYSEETNNLTWKYFKRGITLSKRVDHSLSQI
jgi:hypothetical protein